jgi:hypothetical protein
MTRPLALALLLLLATPRGALDPSPELREGSRDSPARPRTQMDPRGASPHGPAAVNVTASEGAQALTASTPVHHYEGIASWMPAKYGPDYLAMRLPRGTIVSICGPAACWRNAVVMDYGPSGRIHPDRIADIAVGRWTEICGVPREMGLCPVSVDVVRRVPLPETSTEEETE